MVAKDIYQHFRPEEISFIDRIDNLAQRVEDTYTYYVTEFLNPRQVKIVKSILGQRGMTYYLSSDYYQTEYAKVILAPEYYSFDEADFEMTLIAIDYNAKFNQLTHAQIMGTLLNQLGIKRSVLGDILVQNGKAQLVVESSLVSYLMTSVQKIGRASVSLKEVPFQELLTQEQDYQTMDVLVSSMRLDKLIATVLKLSRQEAVKLIVSDRVKVNYANVGRTAELLAIDDMVSVRGFGRFTIIQENGLTKNGKIKLTIEKLIHK